MQTGWTVPQRAPARPSWRHHRHAAVARKMPTDKSRGAGRVHSGIPCAPCAPCCCKESLRGFTPIAATSCSTGATVGSPEWRKGSIQGPSAGMGWTPFDVMTRVGAAKRWAMTVWRGIKPIYSLRYGLFAIFFLLKWESPPAAGQVEKGGVASEARIRRYFSLPLCCHMFDGRFWPLLPLQQETSRTSDGERSQYTRHAPFS